MLPLYSVIEQFLQNAQTSGAHYLITPNRRLTAVLQNTYNQLQRQQNKKSWPSLAALPWDNYIYSLWAQLQTLHAVQPSEKPLPQLLSTQQEFVVWEQIIGSSEQAKPLLKPKAAIQLAMDTYALMRNWRLTEDDLAENTNPDWLVFSTWLAALTEELTQTCSMFQADLIPHLLQQDLTVLFQQKTYVWFYGFERFTPVQMTWLERLKTHYDVQYAELTKTPQQAQIKQQGFADAETEYRACAVWVQQQLEENPQIHLGVVVPQLEQDRRVITKIFREYLCPETLVNRQFDDLNEWVNISGGICLARLPMIHDALQVLSLSLKNYRKNKTNQQKFNQLLRSPFVSYPQSMPSHALPRKQTIAQWAETFQQILAAWDWPGERVLSSEEHQVHKKWWECLKCFRSLQLVLDEIDGETALQQLNQIAETLSFQAQTQEAPVQILGLLEADAQEFDAVWITGLHSQAWPQPIRPNPLLPVELQRQQAMPHASPERELELAKKFMQRFAASAQQIIVSWPQQQEGQSLLASPLIRHYPPAHRAKPFSSFWRVDRPPLLDFFEETHGPIIPLEQALVGGSGLLKAQAECPFKAFVRYRLLTKPYETVSLGLTPQQRGQLVHSVLENFWSAYKTHGRLIELSEAELENALEKIITEVCVKQVELKDFSPEFIRLEQQRLLKITLAWLILEKQREPFEVILIEQSRWVSIQSRSFKIRMDRVDRLASGKQLVIDYKTGEAKKMDWLAERLTEPQLPLYLLSDPEKIHGLMHGHLIAGKCVVRGLALEPVQQKSTIELCSAEEWQTYRAHWQSSLAQLVDEITSGLAVVQPHDGEKTCERCDFSRICRVGEKYL